MKFSACTFLAVMLVLSAGESFAGEYQGCFVKNYEDKLLFPYSKVSRQMDNAMCMEHCKAKGMPYSGTKSVRCGCGTTEQLANMTKAPESECNYDCKTGTGICGGFARLSIYSTAQAKRSFELREFLEELSDTLEDLEQTMDEEVNKREMDEEDGIEEEMEEVEDDEMNLDDK